MIQTRPNFRFTAVLLAFTALISAGCKHDVWEHQRGDVITQYRVPDSAKTVAEGVGVLEYTAPDKGLLYVIDLDQPRTLSNKDESLHKTVYRIVYQALLLEGQQYYFDPRAGLAGPRDPDRAPSPIKVAPDHHYRALFDTKEFDE